MSAVLILSTALLAVGQSAGSGWIASHKFGEHVAGGYVGYLSDDSPQTLRSLWVVIQKGSDETVSVEVGSRGCEYRDGQSLQGGRWQRSSVRERAVLARAALLRSVQHVARRCGADKNALDPQIRNFNREFEAFDRVTTTPR